MRRFFVDELIEKCFYCLWYDGNCGECMKTGNFVYEEIAYQGKNFPESCPLEEVSPEYCPLEEEDYEDNY